ncbi:MAG: SocA family protein [Spirochaetaceae bacterium]|nr:SocA family protein [Spirochaetaceae bacterium]
MFNIEKVIQTCNYLLQKNGGSLNYTKMIKLLYLADRESLNEAGDTITGDTYVSMKNGPVLSTVYNLIKREQTNERDQIIWDSRFTKNGYDLIALSDRIPHGELSRFEMNTLDKLFDQFSNCDFNDMIQYVHNPENCPEWKDTNSSIPISLAEILEKRFGRTPEEIEWIIEEIESFNEEERLDSLETAE